MNIKANGPKVETLQKYERYESWKFSEVKILNTLKLMQLNTPFTIY